MSHSTTEPTKLPVRPAKIRISQADQSLLCTQWVAKDPRFLHADNEHSDQTDGWTNIMFIERSLSTDREMCWRSIRMEKQHTVLPFLGTTENQHLRISWRKPCIWRLDFCKIIKYCSCSWMDHKSKKVCSLIDRFMTSEGSDTLILPFTSKTGQSIEQNRQKIF